LARPVTEGGRRRGNFLDYIYMALSRIYGSLANRAIWTLYSAAIVENI